MSVIPVDTEEKDQPVDAIKDTKPDVAIKQKPKAVVDPAVDTPKEKAKPDVEIVKDGEFHTATNVKRKYIIEYHRDVCIGAASCAAIASATFGMDDENKAFIIGEGEWDDEELIMAAAQSCPVFAIIIKDAATGEQIFPEVF